MISFEKKYLDLERGKAREWVVANGLGGFASSSIIGLNTRKYHGLLIAALAPPANRCLLLSKLEEEIITGDRVYPISSSKYPGVIHPAGFLYQEKFVWDIFPSFFYNTGIGGVGGIKIKKTIFTIHGYNAVVVSYSIKNPGRKSCVFKIKPLVNSRDIHSVLHAGSIDWKFEQNESDRNTLISASYSGAPTLALGADVMDYTPYKGGGIWYYHNIYEKEQERGYEFTEDHFCPGEFLLNIESGETKFNIIAAAGNTVKDAESLFKKIYPRNSRSYEFYELLLNKEKARICEIVEKAYSTIYKANRREIEEIKNKYKKDEDNIYKAVALLSQAADSFIIRKNEGKSIIAGYLWFSDWGRDTMISLTGLCLVTGRYDDARDILKTYTRYCKNGILPNRFDDRGDPGYNTSDASLWFFYAVYKFLRYTGDCEFVKNNLWNTLKDIINFYANGTYTARMESDGLIISGAQTTWMDAKIGDFAVTPRCGKCVEINALWYNALKIMEMFSEKFGEDSSKYKELSKRVKENFNRLFWNDAGGCLYDVVYKDHSDASVRPNQVFAVSLPFSILERKREKMIVEKIYSKLYTPFGLRTLSPDDQNYRGIYMGDQKSRDLAYHQGTAWAWLTGHLITAFVKVNDNSKESKKNAGEFFEKALDNLFDAGIGTISEIFDGDAPHSPRGCVSQAWSVGEFLRCYSEDVL